MFGEGSTGKVRGGRASFKLLLLRACGKNLTVIFPVPNNPIQTGPALQTKPALHRNVPCVRHI